MKDITFLGLTPNKFTGFSVKFRTNNAGMNRVKVICNSTQNHLNYAVQFRNKHKYIKVREGGATFSVKRFSLFVGPAGGIVPYGNC